MATEKKINEDGTITCYCLCNNGRMHCPLTTDPFELENTFNHRVRGEDVIWVKIDKDFVCTDKRTDSCKNCPFNE